MEQLEPEELERMKKLAAMGHLSDDEEVDAMTSLDELELIHMADVIEMQRLLALAATEIERLYVLLAAPDSP